MGPQWGCFRVSTLTSIFFIPLTSCLCGAVAEGLLSNWLPCVSLGVPVQGRTRVSALRAFTVGTVMRGKIPRMLTFLLGVFFRNEKTAQTLKEKVLGTESRGRPGVSSATSQVKNVRQALDKDKHLGADMHDANARTSMTSGGAKKLRAEKASG